MQSYKLRSLFINHIILLLYPPPHSTPPTFHQFDKYTLKKLFVNGLSSLYNSCSFTLIHIITRRAEFMFCIVLEFTGEIRNRVSKFLLRILFILFIKKISSVLFFYDIILEFKKHDSKLVYFDND